MKVTCIIGICPQLGFILREERTFVEAVDGTFGVPAAG
jgi:hypothetical protein